MCERIMKCPKCGKEYKTTQCRVYCGTCGSNGFDVRMVLKKEREQYTQSQWGSEGERCGKEIEEDEEK